MKAQAVPGRTHLATFLVLAAAVYACSAVIAGRLSSVTSPGPLAVGVACDLVLSVPFLYYIFLVRGRGWPIGGVLPLFLLGHLTASRLLTVDPYHLLQALAWAAAPLELVLVGWIGWRAFASVRRIRAGLDHAPGDAFAAIREAADQMIGPPLSGLAAQEIAVLYYAFFSWKTPAPSPGAGFSSHRGSSYGLLLSALMIALFMETFGVHAIVHVFWSPLAALVLTALSLYSAVWLIGDFRALELRATTVTADHLELRLGLRAEARIPRDSILSVGPPGPPTPGEANPLDLVVLGQPDVEIRLSRPAEVRWLLGLRRTASTLRLQVDEPERFIAELSAGVR